MSGRVTRLVGALAWVVGALAVTGPASGTSPAASLVPGGASLPVIPLSASASAGAEPVPRPRPLPPRPESVACGRAILPPFDGHLALRGAYRGGRPGAFQFCPHWSGFGPVRGGRTHGGVDIAAPTGTAVHAGVEGSLSYGRDPGGYGLFARVRFGHPRRSRDGGCGAAEEVEILYAHLQDINPRLVFGERPVRVGEIIGHVGCTGNARGMCSPSPESHLHVTVQHTGGARLRAEPVGYLGWRVAIPGAAERPVEWSACGRGASPSASAHAVAPAGLVASGAGAAALRAPSAVGDGSLARR